ncbi:sigma-54-dependent Fis family transcriptional regulator [bacterium]|nr:MAG: sigma-54-dependent Fis family transcriptional regulator [bacterium]
MASILIVDDDKGIRKQLFWHLTDDFDVKEADSLKQAKVLLEQHSVDIALLDMHMPETEGEIPAGLQMLDYIRKNHASVLSIVMTGDRDPSISLKVVESGAWDVFNKPIDLNELSVVLKRALRVRDLMNQNVALKISPYQDPDIQIVGESLPVKQVIELINQVSSTDATILIQGESGTGKELIAQAIHQKSKRKNKPFIAVNCAALTDTLVEDELFGHDTGAYTGAKGARKGKFELADNGTLFLDEVAELSATAQAKLLRVLQEGTLERLGSEKTVKVNVRVIAATHQDLKERVKEGEFREDLYYRLHVIPIHAPALRERTNDIATLANHFLSIYRQKLGRGPIGFTESALQRMAAYPWPGNVRELKNIIERLMILVSDATIDVEHLPVEIRSVKDKVAEFIFPEGFDYDSTDMISYEEQVNAFRKKLLEHTLQKSRSKSEAAQRLGINRSYLYELMDKLGISTE